MNKILQLRHRPPARKAYRQRSIIAKTIAAVLIVAGLAGYATLEMGLANRVTLAVTAPHTDAHIATFSYCGQGTRITCVVDGDTFWLSGEKIRIADIDAPELNPPRCEAERIKGEISRRRLLELLNAGPLSLVAGVRDEDRYGRKLRTVTRQDRSIGETLIGEGLAHRWGGPRQSWCG